MPSLSVSDLIEGHRWKHYILVQVGVLHTDKPSTVYTDATSWPGMIEQGDECSECGLRKPWPSS